MTPITAWLLALSVSLTSCAAAAPAAQQPAPASAGSRRVENKKPATPAAAPEGVDADDWSMIVDRLSSEPLTVQEFVGRLLAEARKIDPRQAAELRGLIEAQGAAGAKTIIKEAGDGFDPAASARRLVGPAARGSRPSPADLQPGGVPAKEQLESSAPNGVEKQRKPNVTTTQNEHTCTGGLKLDPVIEMLRKNGGQAEVGRVLSRFAMQKLPDNKFFLGFVADPNADAGVRKTEEAVFAAGLKAWVGAHERDSALLYYGLARSKDENSLPAWAKRDLLEPPSSGMEAKLIERLRSFTKEGAGSVAAMGRYGGTQQAEWIDSFFTSASRHLADALGAKCSNAVGSGKEPGAGPAGGGAGGAGAAGPNDPISALSHANYGIDVLWGSLNDGYGDVFELEGNLYAIRVVTERLDNHELRDRIMIADITSGYNIHGRYFNMGWNYNGDFVLDSRNPNALRFKLAKELVNGQIVFKFMSENGTVAKNALHPDGVSLAQMYESRANRAMEQGGQVKIGEKSYYIMPQALGQGCFAFLPKSIEEPGIEHKRQRPSYFGCPTDIADGQHHYRGKETWIGNENGKIGWYIGRGEGGKFKIVAGKPFEPPKKEKAAGDGEGPNSKGAAGEGAGAANSNYDFDGEAAGLNKRLEELKIPMKLGISKRAKDPANLWTLCVESSEKESCYYLPYLNLEGQTTKDVKKPELVEGTSILAVANESFVNYIDLKNYDPKSPNSDSHKEGVHKLGADAANNVENVHSLAVLRHIAVRAGLSSTQVEDLIGRAQRIVKGHNVTIGGQPTVVAVYKGMFNERDADGKPIGPLAPPEPLLPPKNGEYVYNGSLKDGKGNIYMSWHNVAKFRIWPEYSYSGESPDVNATQAQKDLKGSAGSTELAGDDESPIVAEFLPERTSANGAIKMRLLPGTVKNRAALYEWVSGPKDFPYFVSFFFKFDGKVYNEVYGLQTVPSDIAAISVGTISEKAFKKYEVQSVSSIKAGFVYNTAVDPKVKGAMAAYDETSAGKKKSCLGVVAWWGYPPGEPGRVEATRDCSVKRGDPLQN